MPPSLCVVGSVNLDLVARCGRLPRPGETVSGFAFERIPGGKGANQAVAAARLGARVTFVGCVGDDDLGREAVAGLEAAGISLERLKVVAEPTGVALVVVSGDGENQIVVVPGANASLAPEDVELPAADAVLTQLEIPLATVAAASKTDGLFCLNAAPSQAGEIPRADVTIVNRLELDALGERTGLVALTLGAEGAVLLEDGDEIARARPPAVEAVDGTAAGDAFCACLVVSFAEGRPPADGLERACAAGALAASRLGAQPSLPTAAEVDAILAR